MDMSHPIELKDSTAFRIRKSFAISFILCACALALANILLTKQNKELKETVKSLSKASEIQHGVSLPPLKGIDENGNQASVEYGKGDKHTLLLIFSPTCGVCKDNMGNWHSIIDGNKDKLRIIGVTFNSANPAEAKEFINQYRMSAIDIIDAEAQSVLNYKLKYVPQTILIDRSGRVEMVWTGLLNKQSLEEIHNKLNAHLSGSV